MNETVDYTPRARPDRPVDPVGKPTMRTFSAETWGAAQRAWDDGGFSSEWRNLRHTMAMNGCVFPPDGTGMDSWEDDSPSQRAILIRAIRETPVLLDKSARTATSWHQLIQRLLGARDDWRREQAEIERHEEDERDAGATHVEAVQALGAIVTRIADSAGVRS